MQFKILDKVKSKYDSWEGYIDTVTPQGRIRVKLADTYKWVESREIILKGSDNNKNQKKSIKLDYLG